MTTEGNVREALEAAKSRFHKIKAGNVPGGQWIMDAINDECDLGIAKIDAALSALPENGEGSLKVDPSQFIGLPSAASIRRETLEECASLIRWMQGRKSSAKTRAAVEGRRVVAECRQSDFETLEELLASPLFGGLSIQDEGKGVSPSALCNVRAGVARPDLMLAEMNAACNRLQDWLDDTDGALPDEVYGDLSDLFVRVGYLSIPPSPANDGALSSQRSAGADTSSNTKPQGTEE